ncbi:hypothetical protein HPY499_07385 [Helicobacter pylori]|uniref:coiled-coil domain-containing protein n=1 Tax=Helicobacter pylori TaxID=210 RepID=UPI000573C860|nr:hypothetical protein [Helicobacter pylori]KHL89697.1 hypothetical protein HPY499_07385 [Helicobacter pylori]
MDLNFLENALNNGDFEEQVRKSLEGIYQISKVLNQIEIVNNFNEHDSQIVEIIATIKSKLAGYESSEQELKAKIDALVSAIEAKKQELEARLNTELQNVLQLETQKINEAGSEVKNNLVAELTEAKNNLALELEEKLKTSNEALLNTPRIQGVNLKFVGFYVYGRQSFFKNESDEFRELFEFASITLKNNKSYIVQFSMPYELQTNGIYSESMGEMVLCLKANNKVYPIINSFYQNKTAQLINKKIISTYEVNSLFKTPELEADYKIAVFARKYKDLWVNVNYTSNTEGFELSFLNNARFANLTTHSIPTDYNNDWVFFKHSQAVVYEIF